MVQYVAMDHHVVDHVVRELNENVTYKVEKGAALLCSFINYMIEKYICMSF